MKHFYWLCRNFYFCSLYVFEIQQGLKSSRETFYLQINVSSSNFAKEKKTKHAKKKCHHPHPSSARDAGALQDPLLLASTIIPAVPVNGRFYTIEDSIGYYHNKVLLSLKSDICSETLSLDTLIVKVADETYQPYKTNHATIVNNLQASKSSFDKITNDIMPNIHQDADIDAMIERFKEQYPNRVWFLDILKSFLNGLSNIEPSDNDGEYLNKVLALLETTPMRPNAKQSIRNALIVTNASYQLWDISEE